MTSPVAVDPALPDDEDFELEVAAGEDEAAAAGVALAPRRVTSELAGLRADLVLGRLFPEYSRSRLQEWMRAGRVTVDQQPVGLRDKLWTGQVAAVQAPPAVESGEVLPEDIPLLCVFQDAALIVLHKPAGLVVHPGNGNRSGTLQNALLHHDPALAGVPRAGIVHRLDKDTSGLMVVARTLSAHIDLVRQLQARTVGGDRGGLIATAFAQIEAAPGAGAETTGTRGGEGVDPAWRRPVGHQRRLRIAAQAVSHVRPVPAPVPANRLRAGFPSSWPGR